MPKEKKFLLGREAAEDQLDKFCDWYDIDLDEVREVMADSDTPKMVDYAVNKIIKAIRKGLIEVREDEGKDGETTLVVVQKLAVPLQKGSITEIIYHEVTGASRANVRTSKDMNRTAELYQYLAVLSKQTPQLFRGLRGADIPVADSLGFLFLQV